MKKVFLEISQKKIARVSFLIKLLVSGLTLAQVFSCEFCKVSKNTFFHRTILVAASDFCAALNLRGLRKSWLCL